MSKKPGKARAKVKAARTAIERTKRVPSSNVSPNKAEADHPFHEFVDAAALALNLPLDRVWRSAITMNLEIILRNAALVADFSLPDGAEPAPIFKA